MIFLSLLFSLIGIFGFVQVKKIEKQLYMCLTHISRSTIFGRRMWMISVVAIIILPHHLIHLDIFYLRGWRMYGDYDWFDSNFLFFFFSFSFFLILRAGQILFSFDSVIPILIAIVLFTLIVYNSILFFLFYPWWYDFVNFFFY